MTLLDLKTWAIYLLQEGFEEEATELMQTIDNGADIYGRSPIELAEAIELDTGLLLLVRGGSAHS